MKKRYLPLLTIPVAILAVATPAAAHTPSVVSTCSGLSINLTQYEANGGNTNNLVIVGIDNQPPGGVFFGASYSHQFTWSQTAPHSWSVQVDANRTSGDPTAYDRTFAGVQPACQPAPSTTTTPATTSTAPTTTVPSSTTVVVPSTVTTLPVGAPTTTVVTPCGFDFTLPADSPLCVPATTDPFAPPTTDPLAPLPTVPVNTLHNGDVLPRTGSREDTFLFGCALVVAGSAIALIARRKAKA